MIPWKARIDTFISIPLNFWNDVAIGYFYNFTSSLENLESL